MNLILTRNDFSPNGIFGSLCDDVGTVLAATLEHSYECQSKIKPGSYICRRGMHQLEHMPRPFETFEINGVEGHTNILFHVGNYDSDSEGCVLLGIRRDGDMILGSKLAFDQFMALQKGLMEFTLTVVDQVDGA